MIRINDLTKRFGGTYAVRDVSFTCEQGSVTGFLGPNGAGKSTTLRMLTGLTPATSGTATIGGRRYGELPNPGRVVGVMLDASAQHPGRTGRETLRLGAALLGMPTRRADELLEYVGLGGAARQRVKDYSLGMRQRLGIASALLGDPVVLVLDGPANGLDPEGIRWMRGLLRDFAAAGGTVLLSSHLLPEVEATADRLVVIGRGEVRANGSLAELLGDAGVIVRSPDPLALVAALRAAGLTALPTDGDAHVQGSGTHGDARSHDAGTHGHSSEAEGHSSGSDARVTRVPGAIGQSGRAAVGGTLRVEASAEAVARAAMAAGVLVTELRAARDSGLEDLFFSLTSSAANSTPAAGAAAPAPTSPTSPVASVQQEVSA